MRMASIDKSVGTVSGVCTKQIQVLVQGYF